MKKLTLLFALLGVILLGSSGCATATRGGRPNPTIINSTPSGAKVTIEGEYVGLTPCTLTLSPKKDYFIKLEQEAHEPVLIKSSPGVDTAGRVAMIVNGIGIICPPTLIATYGIDYWTKAYKSHRPEILVELRKVAQAPPPPPPPPPPPQQPPPQQPPPAYKEPRVEVEIEHIQRRSQPSHKGKVRHHYLCLHCETRYEITISTQRCPRCNPETYRR